ncbi:MAG: S49 family peptidase [Pseudomonadota bacterium]
MGWFRRTPIVPVLRLSGPIGMATPLRPGLSLATAADAIERAFTMSKVPAVAVVINSPGGSPVQSNLIHMRIRQLAEENKKTVYVFCEDVAASGGYYLAISGDEIYADPSSIIGSIGVISSMFGLDKAIEKLGVERRVYTAGTSKSQLDPFKPENPDDVARLRSVQDDIHDVFIGIVKERRAGKLTGADADMFSGSFWSAKQALELGLIDGIADVRSKMMEVVGKKVKLRPVPLSKGGLFSLFRRPLGQMGVGAGLLEAGAHVLGAGQGRDPSQLHDAAHSISKDVLSSVEERALWSRFGL